MEGHNLSMLKFNYPYENIFHFFGWPFQKEISKVYVCFIYEKYLIDLKKKSNFHLNFQNQSEFLTKYYCTKTHTTKYTLTNIYLCKWYSYIIGCRFIEKKYHCVFHPDDRWNFDKYSPCISQIKQEDSLCFK